MSCSSCRWGKLDHSAEVIQTCLLSKNTHNTISFTQNKAAELHWYIFAFSAHITYWHNPRFFWFHQDLIKHDTFTHDLVFIQWAFNYILKKCCPYKCLCTFWFFKGLTYLWKLILLRLQHNLWKNTDAIFGNIIMSATTNGITYVLG